MKKTEVYVVVDTPEKANKLKRVLDMFGEKYGSYTFELLENKEGDKVYFNMGSEWNTDTVSEIHRRLQEVSIKELRNILAKEHLIPGDIVITSSFEGKYKSILKIKGLEGDYLKVDKQLFVKGSDSIYTYGQELITDFKRYATEEEKALLEPKKELEVGKWYRLQSNNLVFTTSELSRCHVSGYGFSHGGKLWSDEYPNFLVQEFTEATSKEVEQALIEEAKTRGLIEGVRVKCLDSEEEYVLSNKKHSNSSLVDSNHFWMVSDNGYGVCVFNNGQWADIIEQYKFTDSDIAIVERLHDTLLDNHGCSLESKLLTDARMLANKIKSNIK